MNAFTYNGSAEGKNSIVGGAAIVRKMDPKNNRMVPNSNDLPQFREKLIRLLYLPSNHGRKRSWNTKDTGRNMK